MRVVLPMHPVTESASPSSVLRPITTTSVFARVACEMIASDASPIWPIVVTRRPGIGRSDTRRSSQASVSSAADGAWSSALVAIAGSTE
jgi:hypothetical protein